MKDTALGFGIVLVAAAILGGGLTALGIVVGPLRSFRRQVILALFGLALIIASEWNVYVFPFLKIFDWNVVTTKSNVPIVLKSDDLKQLAVNLDSDGNVALRIDGIDLYPKTASSSPQAGPEIYVRICSPGSGPCDGMQVGTNGVAEKKNLPSGDVTIGIYNFKGSPTVSVTSTTVITRKAW